MSIRATRLGRERPRTGKAVAIAVAAMAVIACAQAQPAPSSASPSASPTGPQVGAPAPPQIVAPPAPQPTSQPGPQTRAQTEPLPGLAPGATVRLGPGPYPTLVFRNQRFDPPVTIEAGTAMVMGIRIADSSGIIWRGGNIRSAKGRGENNPDYWGIHIRESDTVTIENSQLSEAYHGMVVGNSRAIIIRNNVFNNLQSDGMDVAGTSDVLIENNRLSGFYPVKATGSHADGTWKDGDHPDAVQIWTSPVKPRVTDITIRGNTIEGDTQGINLFGPKGDGYARIIIDNNSVHITYPPAISIFACDECSIRNNHVWKILGSPYQANIRFEESTGETCGNRMDDWDTHFAMKRCK